MVHHMMIKNTMYNQNFKKLGKNFIRYGSEKPTFSNFKATDTHSLKHLQFLLISFKVNELGFVGKLQMRS